MANSRRQQEDLERLSLVGKNERWEYLRAKVFGEGGDYDSKILRLRLQGIS